MEADPTPGDHLDDRLGDEERRAVAEVTARVTELYREAREAEAQLDAVLATVPAIIWRWDPEARCTYVSDAWTTILGRDPSDALGGGWAASVHPDDVAMFREKVLAAMEVGEPFAAEYRIRHADGTYVTVNDQGRPLDDAEAGRGFVGAALDVTANRLRRDRAERLERLARALAGTRSLDEVADAVLVEALDALDAPHGALGLPTADGRAIALDRQRGFDPKRDRWRALPLEEEAPPTSAFVTGEPCFFPDAGALLERFPGLADQILPYEARMALPLHGHDGPLGVLYAAFDQIQTFDAETMTYATAVADLIASSLERATLSDAAERAADETRVLLGLAAELSGAVSVDDVRRIAVTWARESVKADACLLGIVDPSRDRIAYPDSGAYPPDLVPLLPTSLEPGSSPAADAIRTGRSASFDTSEAILERYPGLGALLDELPFASRVFVPIVGSGAPIGMMVASSRHESAFGDAQVRVLEAVGRQSGQSLERAGYYRDAQDSLSRLSRLQTVTTALGAAVRTDEVAAIVLDASHEALGGSGGGVFLAEGDVLRLTARLGTAADEPYAQIETLAVDARVAACEAYRTGHVVWLPTSEEWRRRYPEGQAIFEGLARSTIAIPFVIEDRVLGSISILFQGEQTLTRAERRLARTIGEQAAQALERARLYEREVERGRRVERLQRVAAELAARATPDEVAEVLTGSGVEAVGAQAGIVVLLDERDTVSVVSASGFPPPLLASVLETPLASPLPGNDAIRTRLPTFLRDQDEIRRRYPDLDPAGPHLEEHAWATLPLVVQGQTIGAVHLSYGTPQRFDAEQLTELAALVSEAALAMNRARRFMREREASLVLQESLLPGDTLSVWRGTGVVTRYWAGAEHLEVGGDWFDVIELPNGKLGLSVGDVVGRGLRAAAAMGQLRSALRGLALGCQGPAVTLQGLDRFATSTPTTELATVVYGELDPHSGAFRYACAGHPPPVACIDGRAEVLDGGRSPLLAAGYDGGRTEAERTLSPGSTVVLYTDGLVERRGESFDRGVERLIRTLERVGDLDLDELSDALERELLRGVTRDDDVAFLCLRIGQPGAAFSRTLGADPAALQELREGLRGWLRSRAADPVQAESMVLAVNEAAANAIEHGYREGPGEVSVGATLEDDVLIIEVRDRGSWRDGTPDPSRGRGLTIMRTLADDVEVDHGDAGTSVRLRSRLRVAEPPAAR